MSIYRALNTSNVESQHGLLCNVLYRMRDQPALVQPVEQSEENASTPATARPSRRIEGVTAHTDCVDLSCYLRVTVRDLPLGVESRSERIVEVPVRCSFSVQ